MHGSLHIGCCGFPVPKIRYYDTFSLVELQATFYSLPMTRTVEKWRKEAPEKFEFTLKAWQLITHEPKSPTYRRLRMKIPPEDHDLYGSFRNTDKVFWAWERTHKVASILGARIIVFQCPASFTPTEENVRNLSSFFMKVERKDYLFVWEPRGDWPRELVAELCRDLRLIHCVDPFKDTPVMESPLIYFRLHGIGGYGYRYSDEDLLRLKAICSRFPVDTYCLFNNISSFEDAMRFLKLYERTL